MTKIRDVLFFGALLATTSAHADQATAFYRQPVYAVGPSMRTCALMPSGVPSGLWGNNGRAKVAESVSPDGQTFTAVGTYDDGTKSVYRFFLNRDECLAFTQATSTSTTLKPNWYTSTLNRDECKIASFSPADRIRMIQESGLRASTRDFQDAQGQLAKVEVSYTQGDYETVYTYFRRSSDCEASLPSRQPVPSNYE